MSIATLIAGSLEIEIQLLPEGFYDTFDYTKTGNNLTHPMTWGLLTKILWGTPGIESVGIDVRLNLNNSVKFQPDLVGYGPDGKPALCIDYESPNSSDARIPTKDVDSYVAWRESAGTIPYFIITTLPDYPSPSWELRYASKGYHNHDFHAKRDEIRNNPCQFWYSYYSAEFAKRQMEGITLINISGKKVRCKT